MPKIGLVNLSGVSDFEIEGLWKLIKLNVTLPDLILFLVFLLALSVDHPISKYYENGEDFKKFKEC